MKQSINDLQIFYEEKLADFRISVMSDLYEKFFKKFVCIVVEDHVIQGHIIHLDVNENRLTHEIRIEGCVVNMFGFKENFDLSLATIKDFFYGDTKEEVLLEMECSED